MAGIAEAGTQPRTEIVSSFTSVGLFESLHGPGIGLAPVPVYVVFGVLAWYCFDTRPEPTTSPIAAQLACPQIALPVA